MLKGDIKSIVNNTQVRWFIYIIIFSIITVALYLYYKNNYEFNDAIRYSIFNIVSVITTSGFNQMIALMGWICCNINILIIGSWRMYRLHYWWNKIFRYQVLYQTAKAQITHLIQPHAVIRPRFNGKPLSDKIAIQ